MTNLNVKTNFLVTCKKIENVIFQCQNIAIPSISLGQSLVPNRLVDYSIPGDKLTFDEINIRFIVDENLENYKELLKWFFDMRDPGRCEGNQDIVTDMSIVILNNNKNPIATFLFADAFPILLDILEFDTTSQAEHQECSVTMAYTYFKLLD